MGFQRGTEEHARFERMATANVVALALAGLFPASIFEATLPQPVGWASDLAQQLFGDEEWDAFNQPLRPITPPVTRLATGAAASFELITAIANGGDPFAAYHAWSLMPFGLFARDAGMVVTNPMSAVDRLTGVPLFAMSREVKDYRARTGEPTGEPEDETDAAEQMASVAGVTIPAGVPMP